MAKKNKQASLKKAPEAPRRFTSAYMFYSSWKHKELRRVLDSKVCEMRT